MGRAAPDATDHPQRALECAIAIQELTPELNRELVEQGAPEVSFGIGLNTGDAVAAHFGGGRRRQYDVVGDTVNVGARLCSAAGRGEIILSDAGADPRHVAAAGGAGRSDRAEGRESRVAPVASGALRVG